MARGRRKATKSRHKTDGGNIDPACMTPRETKFSRGVNGRLSHANRVVEENERITHYFHPRPSPSSVNPEKDDDILEVACITHHDQGENIQTVHPVNLKRTPHRIQQQVDTPQSPSSAFQLLRISLSPKKGGKARRRLNPSQAGNQQLTILAKPACCTKQDPSTRHLTEYFPVRRSERKTKREVLQEKQHRIEAAVLAGCEEGLEVLNFEGKGRGVVATRLFGKGEFVVEYAGELIDMAEAKGRERAYANDQNTGCYMYYFRHKNLQYCVDATAESGKIGRLVNHSRNGNLTTKTVEVDNQPRLVLIAREDITPGEEVTYDYGDRSKESIRHHPWLLS